MNRLSRRSFVIAGSATGVLARAYAASGPAATAVDVAADVFQHGVASGDPLPDRVILWTRVTPTGRHEHYNVQWRIARDPGMRRVVGSGGVWTDAARDFTVKVDADHLEPDTTYYYQFRTRGAHSPVGRTKTLPVGQVDSLRFAFASCSNYPYGFFHVYRRIAERADLDFVLHLGDYLYEYEDGRYGEGASIGRTPDPNHEIVTLNDYRLRHAIYKTDPDLQEVHRQHPFICVWDDHESANDSWRDGAENHHPELGEGEWEVRKRASIRAYFEWMPIRGLPALLRGAIYRAFRFGNLAELDMLDTRLHARDQQAANPIDDAAINDPARELLGADQEAWLFERLYRSQSRGVAWRILGQQTMMAQLAVPNAQLGRRVIFSADQWDGYAPARERVFRHVADNYIDNVVVLTGDIHTSWANELTFDPYDPARYDPVTSRGSLGIELVGPAVSSPGIEDPVVAAQTAFIVRSVSPHMKYAELNKRGYTLVDVNAERLQADWYHVPGIRERTDAQTFAAAFTCASGTNRLVQTATPLAPRIAAPDPAR